jgi:hypothetical protein
MSFDADRVPGGDLYREPPEPDGAPVVVDVTGALWTSFAEWLVAGGGNVTPSASDRFEQLVDRWCSVGGPGGTVEEFRRYISEHGLDDGDLAA